jgi:magnesium chelatase family protein
VSIAYGKGHGLARTIADLEEFDKIATEHISEAIQYRSLDRRMN